MKNYLLAFAILTTTLSAQADYVPGRVRATAGAEMEVVSATGIYKNIEEAKIHQLTQDGAGVVAFTMTFNNANTVRFNVVSMSKTAVGNSYLARPVGTTHFPVTLIIRESYGQWDAILQTSSVNKVSRLVLQGNPEFFAVTM